MNTPLQGDATLTELDHVRLTALARRGAVLPAALRELMDGADLVPSREVPADVVTMYARLQLTEADDRQRELVICYPDDADPDKGFVSVLSPLGVAMLGRRVGDTVDWTTPDGRRHQARISGLDFQPEASGDFVT